MATTSWSTPMLVQPRDLSLVVLKRILETL
jgi:hypothetical protein